jgi:hypothetical protein
MTSRRVLVSFVPVSIGKGRRKAREGFAQPAAATISSSSTATAAEEEP